MRILWIALALAAATVPAHAEGWSVGSNFGFGVLIPKNGGDDLFSVGVPGSVGQLIPGFQPGLRLGAPLGTAGTEAYVDGGLAMMSSTGETITSYQLSFNLQQALSRGITAPYITAGAGILGESFQSDSFSNSLIGAGLGVQSRVAGGHGRVRAEMRIDYIFESTNGLPGGTLFGSKLGFDLLMP